MSDRIQPDDKPRRIAITGSSGLIGRRLVTALTAASHQVHPLVRRQPGPGTKEIAWQPDEGKIDASALEGLDAVIHLAGENIAAGRWTPERKQVIERSRVVSTRLLCETLAHLGKPPKVLVSASAVGYYGDRGSEPLNEDSMPGRGFLPQLCQRWESATEPASTAGIRVVRLRIGIVLAREGGALAKMIGPFKLGLGGKLGNGKQYMSWIAADDLVACMQHLLFASQLAGPVNAVAPSPVTNADFAATLGRVLKRPSFARVPALAIRARFGEMGECLLLASAKIQPSRLQADGFDFAYPTLEAALRHECLQLLR
jgi:uncharacterized protein (TIGR01777 family)